MLRAAAKLFFRQYPAETAAAVQSDFKEMMRLCEHFAARRNDIAHGKQDVVPGRGHYLVPAFYNTKKHKPGEPMAFSYSSMEIRYYANRFVDLRALAERINRAAFTMVRNASSAKPDAS